jgi:hypothetical protein
MSTDAGGGGGDRTGRGAQDAPGEPLAGGGDEASVGEGGTLSDGVGDEAGLEGPAPVPGDDGSGADDVSWAGDAGPREAPPVAEPGAVADDAGEAEVDASVDVPGVGSPEPGERPAADDGTAPGPVPAGSSEVSWSDVEALPSGVVARRGCGSSVDTPGWRIGAIGGFFGSGWGVSPDVHA